MGEDFGDITSETIRDFAASLSPPIPSTLYHYTNPVGFHGIIESRSIWATNIHYLNDASEFQHAIEISRAHLALKEDQTTDALDLVALAQMREAVDRLIYRTVFVVSFSETGDLLSQWRAYCPEGGFSIGFDGEALSATSDALFALAVCIYDPARQMQTVRKVIDWCLADFQRSKPFESETAELQAINRAGLQFLLLMAAVAPLVKHPSFKEEREWRLVCSLPLPPVAGVEFRPNPAMLIPYISCSLGNLDQPLPVDMVVLAPTPHPDLSLLSARGFLERHLIDAPCVNSDVPYRGW